MVQPKFPCVFT